MLSRSVHALQEYLENYGREVELPVSYTDLLYYSHANALRDKKGKLTHWENAVYDQATGSRLNEGLAETYAIIEKQVNRLHGKRIQMLKALIFVNLATVFLSG